MTSRYRIAIVQTHPIQYFAPLWRKLAEHASLDVHVFYASRQGLDAYEDPGFRARLSWDVPLTEGYPHSFLEGCRMSLLDSTATSVWPRALSRILRDGAFQVVLLHGYSSAAALAGLVAALRLGLRVIMRGESHLHAKRSLVSAAAKRALLPRMFSLIDGFLPIGTWNREYWRYYGVPDHRMRMCYYSVDNDFFRSALEHDPRTAPLLRERWNAGPDVTVFLFCGKLLPVKAPEILLEAFAALPGRDRARLVFVGTGPLEARLRSLTHSRGINGVFWEGFANQSKLPHYYAAADVLVLPSRFEPWGLVVNEAMASGTPCIVSNVVGAGPDMVVEPGAGLVFRSDDVASLRAALVQALDPVARAHWCANIRHALARANLDQNVTAIVDLVTAVCSRREMA